MEDQEIHNIVSVSEFDNNQIIIDDFDDLENAENLGPGDDPNYSMSINDIIQNKLSKNIRDLRTFFNSNNFITEKGDQKTNIIDVSARKTYFIPETHVEEFFTILDGCRKEARMLHYSERQETATQLKSGIMIDFDRYQKSKDPQINERHFEALTRHLGKLLREFVDFTEFTIDDKFTFHIFVIRKPGVVLVESKLPSDTPKYKDGFHILIPEIQVSKGLKRYLSQELINRGIIKQIFKDIDHIDGPEKMLDKMSASNPVHFVGNSKPGKPAYGLTHGYELTLLFDDDDIERRALDIRTINAGAVKMSRDGEPIPINLSYELSLSYYMPIFNKLPTWLKKRQLNYKISLETKIQLLVEKTSKDIIPEDDILSSENSVDILSINDAKAKHLKKLLGVIDISYATEYEKWFKVICAIAHTNINYKPLAIWFSHRKPESWSPGEIDRVWNEATTGRFNRKPVTIRSIKHWAQESSPAAFKEIEKENYFEILARYAYANEGRVEHRGAADVCFSMIGDKFVSDVVLDDKSVERRYWFEFVTPGQSMRKGEVFKWRREIVPDNIHLFIGEHLPKVYAQLSENIKNRKDNAANEGEMKYWANVERNFRLYMSKLGNDSFQNGIVHQSDKKFRQRGFIDEIDSYEDIIGTGNGVLKIGATPQLIKGFHEYKISKFTDTDYVPFDPENPCIKILLKAIHDIFPEEDVFEFMMYHAATGLDAKASACILTLLVGGGQNGKSFFAKMVHNALGNHYCAPGKSSLLTSPFEKGNEANSAQMHMKGKRWFYFDEFGKCELLNTARVKSMVNPGYQSGRDVYGSQTSFKNTCNPICLSNFDFIIDTTDHGTWRRMYYYRTKVKFCKNPNPANSFEKLVDSRLMDDFADDPLYKQAMLSILVHYYSKLCQKYKGDLKNVPVPTIERETEDFRNRQDAMNKFITQMIVKSPTADAIGLPTLASKYVEWYNRNVKPSNQTIIDVQSQFENSRIAVNLEHHISGIKFLIGHRLKNFPEESLQDGEEQLTVAAAQHAQLTQPPLVELTAVDDTDIDLVRSEKTDSFIRDLIRNAPTHIQKRNEDNIRDDGKTLDEFLSSI